VLLSQQPLGQPAVILHVEDVLERNLNLVL